MTLILRFALRETADAFKHYFAFSHGITGLLAKYIGFALLARYGNFVKIGAFVYAALPALPL